MKCKSENLSIASRCIGCIIDKLLIFILFSVLLLCIYSPYVVPGWLGTYSVLMEKKPSQYEHIDAVNKMNYQWKSNNEEIRISDYYNRIEAEKLQEMSEDTSLALDVRLTAFFIISNLIYYLLTELVFKCSLGKALLGGIIITTREKWGFSLCLWRSLLLGFMMFVAVCLRFVLDINYYITVLGFVLISDFWILFKGQSLVDILTGASVVVKDSMKESVALKDVESKTGIIKVDGHEETGGESLKPNSPMINGLAGNFHTPYTDSVDSQVNEGVSIPDSEVQPEEIKEELKHDDNVPKYIGYNPINLFVQTEPINYPIVLMPRKNGCVIKFPRKGRNGRKGYKEEIFFSYLQSHFTETLKIYNDRFVLTRNNTNRYEPDFTLIDEKDGINIFMDIEIDEPYEGLNDVNKRKVTHYQFADANRNNEFVNRGWIVVRFAEMQVHQNPEGCCRFIADVIKSINQSFVYPTTLLTANRLVPVRQWSKEQAKEWSVQKYRENYLGIECFGFMDDLSSNIGNDPTELDRMVEESIVDEKLISIPQSIEQLTPVEYIIHKAIDSNKYLSFSYLNSRTVMKPSQCTNTILTGFCYVKNEECSFAIVDIEDICMKDCYYTQKFQSLDLGVSKVADIMNVVIPNRIFVRIKYTRAAWTNSSVDPITGEILLDITNSEESIRTISDIKLDSEGWGDNYIKAYCHKRETERTFRFDRINELELLDL